MNSSESHQNERHANHANQAYQAYYDKFLHFVKEHAHKERQTVNRRLFSVLFWCFLIPTFLVIALSLLVEMNVLSWRFKNYLDWIILIFPVTYLLYYLSAEVLRDIPAAFRRGPMASVLDQAGNQGRWREEICRGMKEAVGGGSREWEWVAEN